MDPVHVHRAVNTWAARIIPVLLIGIISYVTWTTVGLCAVNFLLRGAHTGHTRKGVAIAIIVIHFLLLIPLLACFARLVQTAVTEPSFVPLPGRREKKHAHRPRARPRARSRDAEKNVTPVGVVNPAMSPVPNYLDREAVYGGRTTPPPGLEAFYLRDIFECDLDGLPKWCSACKNWKVDRSHHSTEVGRCVHKMDHFCPWAGGMIAENNYKFFLQFVFYAFSFCIFVLGVMAYFLHTVWGLTDVYNVDGLLSIIFAGLFLLFSFGMTYSSALYISNNTTTVDSLTRNTRAHHFAVLLPSSNKQTTLGPDHIRLYPFPTITYPFAGSSHHHGPSSRQSPRTFAILATPTGSNPYKLASRLDDFRTVMGESLFEWITPFRKSPCASHVQWNGDQEAGGPFGKTMYKFGPVMDEMIRRAELHRSTIVPRHLDNQAVPTAVEATQASQDNTGTHSTTGTVHGMRQYEP